MFEFIVLTVDLMKHLKAFCRIGRNRSGDLRSLFRRLFSFFFTHEGYQVSKIFTLQWNFWNFHVLLIQTHFFSFLGLFCLTVHLDIVSQSMIMKQVQRSCKHRHHSLPPFPVPPILHVRESKTVLDSGFRAVDFGFKVLDSGFFVSGIPDSLSCIPDSKAQDSGFLKQKFPGFGSQEFRTWGEKAAVTKLINCTFFSPIQEPSFLFTWTNTTLQCKHLLSKEQCQTSHSGWKLSKRPRYEVLYPFKSQ